MSEPTSVFWAIGFFVTVLGTGLFIAAVAILAAYGFVTLKKQWERGAMLQKADEEREYFDTIRAEVRR